MKVFLIWLGVSYLIQVLMIVLSVYFMNKKVKTIEDLVESFSKSHYIIWIPVIGLLITILIIICYTCNEIWYKIKRIRIR
jgi:glucan phosphoethanolaminetransferase (alkaline phosphatase superfamily)